MGEPLSTFEHWPGCEVVAETGELVSVGCRHLRSHEIDEWGGDGAMMSLDV